MVKGVLFDFDGTLVDSFSCRQKAHERVCDYLLTYMSSLQVIIPRERLLKALLYIEKEMNKRRIYDRDKWWQEAINRCLKRKSIRLPPSIVREASILYWKTIKQNTRLYPNVKSMLKELRYNGFLLGLVSDTDGLPGMKMQRISLTGLDRFFDAIIVAGEDTRETKPHPEPFLRICDILGISPKECVFVGDDPEVDIYIPKRLGMMTILIKKADNDLKEINKSLSDYIITHSEIHKIPELVLRLKQGVSC